MSKEQEAARHPRMDHPTHTLPASVTTEAEPHAAAPRPDLAALDRTLELALGSLDAEGALLCLTEEVAGRAPLCRGTASVTAAATQAILRRLQGEPLPVLLAFPFPPGSTEPPAEALPCAAVAVREPDGTQRGLLVVLGLAPGTQAAAPRRLQAVADQLGQELCLRRELADARQVAEALKARFERLRQDQEGLVRAIDHRIRNGLQMVNDMLALQAMSLGDTEAAAQLDAAAGRVQAVAEAHAHLQRQPATGLVSARDYVALLLRRLRQCWPDPARPLLLRPAPDLAVSALDAPRIGIIAWELLVNALRHGRGRVEILLQAMQEANQLRIVVRDEGPGPDAATLASTSRRGNQESGLGLIRLIAGGHAASVEPGQPAGVGITVSLRRPLA